VIGSLLLILAMFEATSATRCRRPAFRRRPARRAVSITLGAARGWHVDALALFGGDFPGDTIVPRLYALHILIFPAIMLALIGIHLALVWFQKHTQFPGPGRTRPMSSACGSCRCSR